MGIQWGHRGSHEPRFYPYDPRLGISNPRSQPCAHHLLDAWLVRVEQRPGLHVFRYKAAAHAGDVLPVPQSGQCHVLICGLLLTCGDSESGASTQPLQNRGDLCWGQELRSTKLRVLTCQPHLHLIARETGTEEKGQELSCTTEPRQTSYEFGLPGFRKGVGGGGGGE